MSKQSGWFFRDDRGSATIEAVLWLPIFVFFITLVFDASMLFYNQSRVLRIVQDANRMYSVGWLKSESEVKDFVEGRVGAGSTASMALVGSHVVQTAVTVNAGALGGVGMLKLISDLDLTISAQHMIEG